MLDFFASEIQRWLHSPKRKGQADASRYLAGQHDILTRTRTVIGRHGKLEPAYNLPNNRLVDNQYAKLVRQKVHYLVGNAFTFGNGSRAGGPRTHFTPVVPGEALCGFGGTGLEQFFTPSVRKTIRSVCEDAVSGGIGWVMPCFDAGGAFHLRRIPPYELLPFWADSEHTTLDCAARVYDSDAFDPARKRPYRTLKVELFTPQGVQRYTLESGKLVPDSTLPSGPWITVNGKGWNWRRGALCAPAASSVPAVPLIPFKAPGELSLLSRVKPLQDALNTLISDYQNNLQEDARNTILVLKNYDGGDLAEFRHNLAAYGAVKVRTVDNAQGGVETLRVNTSHEGYLALAETLKRAIIENGMGFDIGDASIRGTPNQMTLLAMTADIELDAHGYEAEWKASFDELLSFVRVAVALGGGGEVGDVEVRFNKYKLAGDL